MGRPRSSGSPFGPSPSSGTLKLSPFLLSWDMRRRSLSLSHARDLREGGWSWGPASSRFGGRSSSRASIQWRTTGIPGWSCGGSYGRSGGGYPLSLSPSRSYLSPSRYFSRRCRRKAWFFPCQRWFAREAARKASAAPAFPMLGRPTRKAFAFPAIADTIGADVWATETPQKFFPLEHQGDALKTLAAAPPLEVNFLHRFYLSSVVN